MLYEQIRHTETIRKMYRLRHLLAQKNPPELGTRLGYAKYSKQFYRVKSKLRKEGIIDKQNRFVASLLNLQIVKMPLHASKEQIDVLGNKVPYYMFLALVVDAYKKTEFLKEFHFSRRSIYNSLRRMEKAGLVNTDYHAITADETIKEWFTIYLELVRTSIDATGDISFLFNTIPSCIGGPYAYHMTNYEPGRPVGPPDMLILTYGPFLSLIKSLVQDSRYFKDYPKKVQVCLAKDVEVEWIDRIPYDKNAKEIWK